MSVLLADRLLGVQRRGPVTEDASGYPLPGALQPLDGPWPARAVENPDHSWVLALDPAVWPLREGDRVLDPVSGAAWLVSTADLLSNTYDDRVDYVRVLADPVVTGGTRPPGTDLAGPA